MTGQQKVVKFIKDVKEMTDAVNKKYGKILKDISEIEKEIKNLKTTCKDKSEEFIADQQAKLQKKLDRYQQKAEEFVQQKQDDLEKMLDAEKKKIMDRIMQSKLAMTIALQAGNIQNAVNTAKEAKDAASESGLI